ncbi:MAG TPA: DUF2391 family protein [Candidatus Nanoarchaeia archaeon]|nr:DUF2391 family protein [Candidatus Nanoarchaeia archaeon]
MPKRVTLAEVSNKLDRLMEAQKRLLSKEVKVEKKEALVEREEKEELKELKELEAFEKEIISEVGEHPLRKLTYRDIAKGSVGAFIGVAAHYTFVYSVKVAAEIDLFRATLLFPISFALGGVFMYVTGYRKIKDPKLMYFLPVRLTVLYIVSVITAMLTLWLFNPQFLNEFWPTYKQVATLTLSAVIGACTADLIGKE